MAKKIVISDNDFEDENQLLNEASLLK
jgi:hypothetical protein